MLYELKWGAMVNGKYELLWQESMFIQGSRFVPKLDGQGQVASFEVSFQIPLTVLAGLKPNDKRLHFQLVAIDVAGNRSPTAETQLKTSEILILLKTEKEKTQYR